MSELAAGQRRKFLGAYFAGCQTYGRLYLRPEQGAYVGSCPRCGCPVRVKAAPGGVRVGFVEVLCRSKPRY